MIADTQPGNKSLESLHTEARLTILPYLASRGLSKGVIGGAETFALTLCENLDHAKVLVIMTAPQNEEIMQRAGRMGIELHPFPAHHQGKLSYLRRLISLALLLRRLNVDVVHVHSTGFTGLNAFSAARLANVPVVVTQHAWYGAKPTNWAERLSKWCQIHWVARILVPHHQYSKDLAAAGIPAEKIIVVPNAVDVQRFAALDAQHRETTTSMVLVSDPGRAAEMGRNARLRVEKLFSAEALGRSMTAIYIGVKEAFQVSAFHKNGSIPQD